MGIQSFLKATKGDPDWAFTPEHYFGKEFKLVDAHTMELAPDKTEQIVLRQNPVESELLAKHIKIEIRENSTLDLTIINEATNKLQQVFIYNINLRDGASLNLGAFIKDGRLNKHIFEITLGDLTTFNSYGYVSNHTGGDSEIITKINHTGSYTISNQITSCEAGPKSQTVAHVLCDVHDSAKHTQINVDIANLVAGDNGKCHSIPEIYNKTDTTRINCVTSTDIVDQERIYYLQTRGMSEVSARSLLLSKHRSKILELINDPELVQEIDTVLM
jgi:Fe-S cluster assembly protein SufD